MGQDMKNTIVTIADRNFVLPVFILILSLKYYQVKAKINILGVGLSDKEKQFFKQFEGVKVFDADLSNKRNPTTRKGEAILTAENDGSEYITLLDGDCIVTGDITLYLTLEDKALYVRFKSKKEDGMVFSSRYDKDDELGTIPKKILEIWKKDVGENNNPSISNTVTGGNLIVHHTYLNFIRKWHNQIMKVVPNKHQTKAHDHSSFAYSQLDESVLNSLLAFAKDVPPLKRHLLDKDPNAYIAHLGPSNPKFWVLWPKNKLEYFNKVMFFIDWAKKKGYKIPNLSWSLKKRNKPFIYVAAYGYKLLQFLRNFLKNL
jgi:hypothetical protein